MPGGQDDGRRSDRSHGTLALGLVDEPAGQRRLGLADKPGVLGEPLGQDRVGIQGALDAPGDGSTGSAELGRPGKRRSKTRAEDERQSIRLGHQGRHGADRPGDDAADAAGLLVVLSRGGKGVVGGGQLLADDGQLGVPAGNKLRRGRWIFQRLAQGLLSSGKRPAEHAKILASRMDLVAHGGLVNAAPNRQDGQNGQHGGDDAAGHQPHAGIVHPSRAAIACGPAQQG